MTSFPSWYGSSAAACAKWPGHVDVQTASGKTPGTISIPAKTRIKVASLKIGGVAQPEGSYRKNSAPPGAKPGGTFVGDGILRVGDLGIVIRVK